MKRKVLIMLLFVVLLALPVFAGGDTETKKNEKVIRVAEQVPGLITPGSWDGQAFSLNTSIYEYLVEINPDTAALAPVLATEWSTTDGTRWTFKLQEGVKFHDGTDFTSEDVKFTIERTQDQKLGHLKQQDFAIVESIETPDDYTVILNLKDPRPTFIYQLTDYNMAMLSSEYDYAKYGESKPMGTGPFKLIQYIPKESASLAKNDSYWNSSLPKIDKLNIYFVADVEARASMLEAGRVDTVPYVSPNIKNRLAGIEGVSVISPYQDQRFVAMNVDEKPWDDNRVRLAFKYAMDPQMIAKSVTQMNLGEGTQYNETPIMNLLAEHVDIPLRERDLEKSRSLLTEAGYPDGVTVKLYYASDQAFSKQLAQTLKELSAPAGFTLELNGFTRDIYLSQYWLNVPMSITTWGGRIDPSMILGLAFKGGGSWNESHLDNPVINDLIDAISEEINEDQRNQYYAELQQIFHDEGTVINVQIPYLVAISDKVINYRQPITMIPQYKYMDIL